MKNNKEAPWSLVQARKIEIEEGTFHGSYVIGQLLFASFRISFVLWRGSFVTSLLNQTFLSDLAQQLVY